MLFRTLLLRAALVALETRSAVSDSDGNVESHKCAQFCAHGSVVNPAGPRAFGG